MDSLKAAAAQQKQEQDAATQSVKNGYQTAETATNNAVDNMKNKLGELPGAAKQAGQGIAEQLGFTAQELEDRFKNATNTIRGMLSTIVPSITGSLPLFFGNMKIPKLAQGAVLPAGKPFLAMLGDQQSGRNLEAPESLIRQIVREETANIKGGGNNTYTVPVQVGRQTLFTLVLDEAELRRNQTGENPFTMGAY